MCWDFSTNAKVEYMQDKSLGFTSINGKTDVNRRHVFIYRSGIIFGLGLSASLKNEPVCQTISSLIVCWVTGGQWSCCIGLTGLNQLVQKQHSLEEVYPCF